MSAIRVFLYPGDSTFTDIILRDPVKARVFPPFVPIFVRGTRVLSSFGNISSTNPAVIAQFSPEVQNFHRPIFTELVFARAVGWNDPGQAVMPGQLLIAPGSGFSNGIYVSAGGDATLPVGTINGSLVVTLYHNVFTIVSSEIQTISYPRASMTVPVIPGATVPWSVNFLAFSDFIWGDGFNKQFQFSVGVNLYGMSLNAPLVRMMQFDLQA